MRLANFRLRLVLAGFWVILFIGGGTLDRSRISGGLEPFLNTGSELRLGTAYEFFHSPIYEAERFWIGGAENRRWAIKAGKFQLKWLHFWVCFVICLFFPKMFERIRPNS